MSATVTFSDFRLESNTHSAQQMEDGIIRQAIALLERRVFKAGPSLNGPPAVRDYLHLQLMAEPNEVFVGVFLNSQCQVLACELLFKGTVNETAVYPRVVVQRALELRASSLIFAHQHPSGATQPSAADRAITRQLKDALSIVDIRVLDHFIIGKGKPFSFAESGLL